MSRQRKKTVSLLLAVAMVLSVFAGYPLTVSAATPITGGEVISESGVYEVASDATGDITINEGLAVTLVGNGVGEGKAPNSNLTINCGAGVDLTVENLWINNGSAIYALNYTGSGNKLNLSGTNLIETEFRDSEKATIHVASGTDLTIDGEGTLYGYKSALGSLIGGDGGNSSAEASGKITINGGTLFLKGSKVGAVIGTGGQRQDVAVGDVIINGGNVNIANKAMGAGIGGGKEEPGGTVYINGGNVSLTTDFNASTIGAGGGGTTPKDSGTVYITGGSLKNYITNNAANGGGYGPENEGINDLCIRADKKDGGENDVAKCVFDTAMLETPASEFTVETGGKTYYQGGLHGYDYAPDVSITMDAWVANTTDKNLYLYLSKENHELNVNGEKFRATWDETNSTFKVERISSVDVSWYNTTDNQFTITTGKQLAGLATIVNGTADGIERDSFQGKTITLGNDIDLSQVEGENQAPIGTKGKEFQGTFDGNGKTITGLNLSGSSGYLGLFGSAGAYSIIKNFTLEGNVADSSRNDFVGGVTGFNAGIISDTVNKATVNAPGVYNVGAMAGLSTSGKWISPSGKETVEDAKGIVERCTNYATITGYNKVGGMVGENAGIIRISVNHGKIDGTNASSKNGVGGITGRNGNNNAAYETGVIVDCYNTGEVGRSGQKWVGGIVGFQNAKSSVTNAYNVGNIVKGAGYNNPIIGQEEGKTKNCYALDTLYASSPLESEKGVPKTESELKSEAFIAQLNGSGAAFMMDNAENPINNGYPILKWEQKTAAGVDALIEAIGEVTLNSEGVIVAARDAYIALSDTEKAKVTKLGVLEAAEARYAELKAAQELTDAKEAAKTELKNYKDPSLYRDAEKAILADEVTAGKAAIDEAGTMDEVNGALAAAKAKIDAIKTDAQYVAEEKAAAEAVDALIEAIGEVILESKDTIDSARNGYDALSDNEKAYVTKLETLEAAEAKYAELKAAKELSDAKEAAKTELENYKDPALYRDAEKAILADEIAAGKSNIDGAESIVEVNAALAAAKIKIDAIKTDAQYVVEEQQAASAVDALIEAIGEVTLESKDAIDSARNGYDTLSDGAKAYVTKLATLQEAEAKYAELKAAEELADAKEAAKTELENYKDPSLYRDAEKAILADEVTAGKTAIDEAGTIDEVNEALTAAKAKIDAIKTDAQYGAEELAAAKEVAKGELENYKDPALYRDAEKAILAAEVAAGKSNIDGADSMVEVNTALAAAKTKIDAIKTDAQYKADAEAAAEAVDVLIEAIGEVTTEKKEAIEKATNAYNALDDEAKALVKNHDQLAEAQQAYKAMTQAPSFILEFPREANEEKLVKIKDGKLIFTTGESKGLVIRLVEGEMDRFINVTMDGKVVDPANYFVREGSIVVEFNRSYLETLAAGKHKVRINTNKGYGESQFFIARAEVPGQQDVTKPPVPDKVMLQKTKVTKTGDAQDMTGAYLMTLLALGVLLSLAAGKRRKENNR